MSGDQIVTFVAKSNGGKPVLPLVQLYHPDGEFFTSVARDNLTSHGHDLGVDLAVDRWYRHTSGCQFRPLITEPDRNGLVPVVDPDGSYLFVVAKNLKETA